MKHRLFISVFLILVLSLSLLTACGQKSAPADTEDASAETMTDDSGDSLKVIGIKAGSNTSVTLKNKTGQDIRDITVKASTEEEYPAGLLAASDALKNNESRVMYYTLSDDKNVTYDVRLSLEDGTECVLHGFPFNDTENCTIWLDGVAYIEYLSNRTGNKENTRTVEVNTLLAQEEGVTLEELASHQGSTLKVAATPAPSPSAAARNNTSGNSGRSSGSGAAAETPVADLPTTTIPAETPTAVKRTTAAIPPATVVLPMVPAADLPATSAAMKPTWTMISAVPRWTDPKTSDKYQEQHTRVALSF